MKTVGECMARWAVIREVLKNRKKAPRPAGTYRAARRDAAKRMRRAGKHAHQS